MIKKNDRLKRCSRVALAWPIVNALMIICSLFFIMEYAHAEKVATDDVLQDLIRAVSAAKSTSEKMKLCTDALQSGKLTKKQSGLVYGLTGAIIFSEAMDRLVTLQSSNSLTPEDEMIIESLLRDSIQRYNTAIALNPNNFMDFWNRGFNYELLGNQKNALSDYSEAIKLNPDFVKLYQYRARVYEMMGEIEKSRLDLEKAASLQKQEVIPANKRGTSLTN